MWCHRSSTHKLAGRNCVSAPISTAWIYETNLPNTILARAAAYTAAATQSPASDVEQPIFPAARLLILERVTLMTADSMAWAA